MQSERAGRILFVVPSLSNGGAERVVSVLASNLAEKGFDTSCVVYYKAETEYLHSKKINIRYLAGQGEETYKVFSMKQKINKLSRLIDDINPEYIIPFLPQVGFHVFLATVGKKYKIIQTVRNNPRTDPETKYERIIRNCLVSLSWRSFVQNREQLEYFPKFLHKKLEIIPNPISNQFFNCEHVYHEQIKEIVAMGRLSEQKNFQLIIETAKRIRLNYPDIHFSIFGDGPLKKKLQEYINKYHLEKVVTLQGRTNNSVQALNSADLFILSSNYEGMPNALLEAMAIGLPCISTNCPTGPADIIDNNRNGKLVQVNNIDEMVSAIDEYVELGVGIADIGEEAKKFVKKNYSAEVITDMFLQKVLQIHN